MGHLFKMDFQIPSLNFQTKAQYFFLAFFLGILKLMDDFSKKEITNLVDKRCFLHVVKQNPDG